MPSITSNSKMRRALLACAVTLVLFGLMRCVFFVIPDAFAPYPEALFEVAYYTTDLRCKLTTGSPQVLVQGTSRLQIVGNVPIGRQYRREGGETLNVSLAGQTFWHMMAMRRRHPDLFARCELSVTDLVPMGLYIGENFDETSALFFRDSTLAEKWLILDPLVRARALADVAVPAWSRRYRPLTWWKALTHLHATDQERLDMLLATPVGKFPEMIGWDKEIEETANDPIARRRLVAGITYPLGPLSQVQMHAFRELVSTAPPNGYMLLTHPPHRADFDAIIDEVPERRAKEREFKQICESMASERVAVRWYDDMDAFGLADEDLALDGVHMSQKGWPKLERYIGRVYRELLKPSRANTPND